MSFIYYYEGIVKYDLLNKFHYKNIQQFPKLKKITLSFRFKTSDFKQLFSSLIALELITYQKSIINKSKVSNIIFKIRKGNPVGCKLTLRKKNMYKFFAKILLQILPHSKIINKLSNKNVKNSISFEFNKILLFPELENQYQFFNKLSNLHIVIVTSSKSYDEIKFLLRTFKLLN